MTTTHNPPPAHHFPIRIYYEDTDAGSVVYYANYLKFAERARTEMVREQGHNWPDVLCAQNIYFVARHVEADYLASARLDDLLDVKTEFTGMGAASLTAKQSIMRGDTLLAEIKTVLVCVTPAGKPVRIPPQLRQIFGG
jgi:acyl-CoA thioester hydrolase